MSKIVAKRVSNYELFYDLVFVFTTSSLTGLLHNSEINLRSLLAFIAGNIIISSLWINETFLYENFKKMQKVRPYDIIKVKIFMYGLLARL